MGQYFFIQDFTLTGVLLFLFDDILPVLLTYLKYWLCIRDHQFSRPMADQIGERISVYSEDRVPRQNVTNKFENWIRRYNTELPRNLIEMTF